MKKTRVLCEPISSSVRWDDPSGLSGGCEGQARPDSSVPVRAHCVLLCVPVATGPGPVRSLDVTHCVPRSVLEMHDLVSPGETRL